MMPDDRRQTLLCLLAADLPSRILKLTADQLILGEPDHPRVTSQEYPPPAYVKSKVMSIIPRHIMPEFCYLAGGRLALRWADRYYCLTEGDVCLVPRMTYHYESCVDPGTPYQTLWFGFAKLDRLWVLEAEYLGAGRYAMHNIIHFGMPPTLVALFPDPKKPAGEAKDRLRTGLASLFTLISRKIADQEYFIPILDESDKKWKQRSLFKVQDYIEKHLTEKLTLEQIAGQLALSTRSLESLFKLEYGDSVFEYIILRRLAKACQLLEQTTLNISEITEQLHYEDIYYFSRQFKKYYGISPTEYRDKYL